MKIKEILLHEKINKKAQTPNKIDRYFYNRFGFYIQKEKKDRLGKKDRKAMLKILLSLNSNIFNPLEIEGFKSFGYLRSDLDCKLISKFCNLNFD